MKSKKGISSITLIIIIAVIVIIGVVIFMMVSNNGSTENNSNLTEKPATANNAQTAPSNNQSQQTVSLNVTSIKNAKETDASKFQYQDNGNDIKITEYIGTDDIVIVPSAINGKPVTELAPYIFANNIKVKAVRIPGSIKKIDNTFGNNDYIEIVVCEGIEEIGYFTFANCANLHTIVLSDSLSVIGEMGISSCPKLKEVYISSNVKNISDTYAWSVFYNCPNLTVKGKSGSYIEQFCKNSNINFVAE